MSFLFKISRFELLAASIMKAISTLKDKINTHGPIDEKEMENILSFERKTLKWHKTIKRYHIIIIAMYIGLYFSFASLFFSNLFLVSEIIGLLATVVSITGTTLFLIVLSISQYIREVHLQRLNIIYSHVMLLCARHDVEPQFLLESNDNEYREMVELLKALELQRKKDSLSKKIDKGEF